jgi:hypothetical protein
MDRHTIADVEARFFAADVAASAIGRSMTYRG